MPVLVNTVSSNPVGPSVFLLSLLVGTAIIYWPGLTGGFLHDDVVNLDGLGVYGGVTDWDTLVAYLKGGDSGPTGRPISMISFLLDDNTWPSQATYFKRTNLAIHLLCGVFLAWATILLLRFYGFDEVTAQWMAVFSACCWLIHPFLVSTTLYVVQRMSQMAALFVYAGIAAYLHGRLLWPARPRMGYLWMGGGIVIGTTLAMFSKENGILLPLLVGVIEFCGPVKALRISRSLRVFRFVFIGLPAIMVLAYLVLQINLSENPWPSRGFNQVERVLTESRIVVDYLGNMYWPRIEGQGLYNDDIVVSRSLIHPRSTIISIVFLLFLIGVGIKFRKPYPLFGLGVLFFFVGHLLESSVIGLELYYEHRNYLPSAFLFLPVASGINCLYRGVSHYVAYIAASLVIMLLAFFTFNRAQLWASNDSLELFWATSATNSPRAINALAGIYMRQGQVEDAHRLIDEAWARLPDSSILTMTRLVQRVAANKATEEDFDHVNRWLGCHPVDNHVITGLRALSDKVIEAEQPSSYRLATLRLLDGLEASSGQNSMPETLRRLLPYLKGRIHIAEHSPANAYVQLSRAMNLLNDADSSLQIVALMANGGYPVEALRLFDQGFALYRQQPENTLIHSREIFDSEFARIRNLLKDDLQAH